MADKLTVEKRSWNMSRIKGQDTKPEIAVRSLLHRMGYRFRLQRKDLPGKPDIVLPKYKTAIFVHGCFWHAHGCKDSGIPKSNTEFWQKKLADNVQRDARKQHKLLESGWRILVVWECQLNEITSLEDRLKMAFEKDSIKISLAKELKIINPITRPRHKVLLMNNFISSIEVTLLPLTSNLQIEGSEPKAITHQWAQSIATGSSLFGGVAKSTIVSNLKKAGLYSTKEEFQSRLFKEIVFPPPLNPKFQFIDLFAGIGGFRIALQEQGGSCVFSSEWDKAAQVTYERNYGELPFGDITSFTNDEITDTALDALIPDHDILAGGFPCQPFSHAGVSARTAVGKEHGFKCNTQGTLFFDIMRIASIKRPKVLFLENVKNIKSHDTGRTFQVIKDSIAELGYDFEFSVIDSSTLVPQRRKRCYMVCFRKDLNVEYTFPSFDGVPLALNSILETHPDDKFTISDKLWAGHINRTQRNLDRGTGFTAFTADLTKPSATLVARYGKDGKECLIPQIGKNPRLLTPRECARLQGYPDSFLFPEAKTPAYRQFGNSVSVPVVTQIANSILGALK